MLYIAVVEAVESINLKREDDMISVPITGNLLTGKSLHYIPPGKTEPPNDEAFCRCDSTN